MTDFQLSLVKEFNIPVKDADQKIWMLRTESGKFYRDFTTNNYVALGWDKIPFSLIDNKESSNASKKEQIQLLYPDESKPGLILNQITTFYFRMKSGDLILIPSHSSKQLYIGELGEVIMNIEHKEFDEEYDKCEYVHKRSVKWIKTISPNIDIYLNKALRSHQAITDVSKYSDVFFRNVFPYYISDTSLHLTFQKNTDSNYSVCDNIKLQSSVLEIFQLVSKLYGIPDNSDSYIIKTAVGSPGIIEFIIEKFNDADVVGMLVLLSLFGFNYSIDSEGKKTISGGITGIINIVNHLLNEHKNRQMIDVDMKLKEAEIRKLDAETEQIKRASKSDANLAKATVKSKLAESERSMAEAKKIISESQKIDAETELMKNNILQIPNDQQIQDATTNITSPMQTLQQITENNNINISA